MRKYTITFIAGNGEIKTEDFNLDFQTVRETVAWFEEILGLSVGEITKH